jgi:hypothetical protein
MSSLLFVGGMPRLMPRLGIVSSKLMSRSKTSMLRLKKHFVLRLLVSEVALIHNNSRGFLDLLQRIPFRHL